MSDLHCPNCGAGLDLATAFGAEADAAAVTQLARLSVPLGARVLQYVQLFKPARQALTTRKKVKLVLQLLPDLQRGAIAHAGREWQAPRPLWAAAIDQMLALAAAGKLDLPMTGHRYLYTVLAGMADKAEAQGEREREGARRTAGRTHSSAAPTAVAAGHNRLAEQIRDNRDLFVKPRTCVVDGMKYGLQKRRGKMSWADDAQLVARIKRLAARRAGR